MELNVDVKKWLGGKKAKEWQAEERACAGRIWLPLGQTGASGTVI